MTDAYDNNDISTKVKSDHRIKRRIVFVCSQCSTDINTGEGIIVREDNIVSGVPEESVTNSDGSVTPLMLTAGAYHLRCVITRLGLNQQPTLRTGGGNPLELQRFGG